MVESAASSFKPVKSDGSDFPLAYKWAGAAGKPLRLIPLGAIATTQANFLPWFSGQTLKEAAKKNKSFINDPFAVKSE